MKSLLLALVLLGSAPTAGAQVLASHARAYAPRYTSSRCWVPARYEWVVRTVWVPGCVERVWIEPVYAFRLGSCGQRIRVLLRDGHWTTIERPGHYATRRERVWRPGCWAPRG